MIEPYNGILFNHKKNEILIHATTRIYLESIILCSVKEARHKRTHIVSFHLYEMSKIGKSIETRSKLVVGRGYREGKMGSDYLWVQSGAFLGGMM